MTSGDLGDSLNEQCSGEHWVYGCMCTAVQKVTLGGICLPLFVVLSGLVSHPLERQDTCLLGLLVHVDVHW